MKVTESALLSLFLLFGNGADLVNGFQVTPKTNSHNPTSSPPFAPMETTSYYAQSITPDNGKNDGRWTAGKYNIALRMTLDGSDDSDGDHAPDNAPMVVVKEGESSSSDDTSDEVPVAAWFASPSTAVPERTSEESKEGEEIIITNGDNTAPEASSEIFFAIKQEPTNAEAGSSDEEIISSIEATEAPDDSEDSSTIESEEGVEETKVEEALSSDEPQDDDHEEEEKVEMTVDEILEVAQEMEEVTQSLTKQADSNEEQASLEAKLEPINNAARKVIDFIKSPPPPKTKDDEKIEIFVQALGDVAKGTSGEIARNILGSLRMSAASALTKSLPDEDRVKLLERMNVPTTVTGEESELVDDDDDEEEEEEEEDIRGSVAEEIAAAKTEQARRDEEIWAAEKEALIRQMNDAANARVENELAIQKKRLYNEMKEIEESLEQSKQKIQLEKIDLEEQKIDLEAQLGRMDAQLVSSLESQMVDMKVRSEEVDELQSIIDKRDKQKVELSKVEDNLRLRLEEIDRQKQQVAERTKELQAAELKAAESNENDEKQQGETTVKDMMNEEQPEYNISSVHPVLGPMLCDLGYKRIYLPSSGTLGTLPIWKKQRIYRHSRARSMALDKAKFMENGFPGAVCLHEDSEGKLSVLDGQHRIGMMQMLREMENAKTGTLPEEMNRYFGGVLVEVYQNSSPETVEDDKHAESVFLEINKAEPVKLVDMPGVASARDNKIITQAVSRLEEQFPKMFSSSQKCRVPNVNVDNLRNNIFGANIMKRHRLRSSRQLFGWLLVQNAALGASYELNAGRRETIRESAWEKASENAFYLGLESSWLYV